MEVDKGQVIIYLQPQNSAAEEAVALPPNDMRRVNLPSHTSIIESIPRDLGETTPKIMALVDSISLDLRQAPRNPSSGYVFGSDEASCDVLLDRNNRQGISRMYFAVNFNWTSNKLIIECLARSGIHLEEGPRSTQLKCKEMRWLNPAITYRVTQGVVLFQFRQVDRNTNEQRRYPVNVQAYKQKLVQIMPQTPEMGIGAGNKREPTAVPETINGHRGEYTALQPLGFGAMGSVCLAANKQGYNCTIKYLRVGNHARQNEMFKREIRMMAELKHPNIVRYIDHGYENSFMVMEHASAGNLASQYRKAPFSNHETDIILHDSLDALAYLHSYGIIHHDIKPENILVHVRKNGMLQIKLADFGLSEEYSQVGHPAGTATYSAPEVFLRVAQRGKKIDVWAIGLVALQCLAGLPQLPAYDHHLFPFYEESPLTKGWNGEIREHLTAYGLQFGQDSNALRSNIYRTLEKMLRINPAERIGAWDALGEVRKISHPRYFRNSNTLPWPRQQPQISARILAKDPQPDALIVETPGDVKASLFQFSDLRRRSNSFSLLEAGILVSLDELVRLCSTTPKIRRKYKELALREMPCWQIMRMDHVSELYLRADMIINLFTNIEEVEQERPLPLELLQVLEEALKTYGREKHDPWRRYILNLIRKDIVIVFLNQRVVLVRLDNGYVNESSISKVYDCGMLLPEDVKYGKYVPLEAIRDRINLPKSHLEALESANLMSDY